MLDSAIAYDLNPCLITFVQINACLYVMSKQTEILPADPMPAERQRFILERLSSDGRVLAADIARALGASEDTIRRDLREMAGRGVLKRVYGGALPVSPASGSFEVRQQQNVDGKQALARLAATLAAPGQLLFLDAGSTNLAIAEALPENLDLTVATNAPAIAMALMGRPGISVILIGGAIDAHVGGSVGAKAVRDVELLRVDLCFLGTCALDEASGASVFSFEDAEFKRALVRISRSIAIVATTEKLGTAARYPVLDVDHLHHLVVDRDAPVAHCAAFVRAGVTLHQLPEERQSIA